MSHVDSTLEFIEPNAAYDDMTNFDPGTDVTYEAVLNLDHGESETNQKKSQVFYSVPQSTGWPTSPGDVDSASSSPRVVYNESAGGNDTTDGAHEYLLPTPLAGNAPKYAQAKRVSTSASGDDDHTYANPDSPN